MNYKWGIIKSILKSKVKRTPYKLNFAVTSACNSRCKTCNVWKVYKDDPSITKQDLDLKEIEKIFANLPDNFSWLSLSGGEPFLRTDLADICRLAAENIPSLALVSIPTNGLAIQKILTDTKRMIEFPLRNIFLNFSLDGPPAIHNKVRGLDNAFKRTWATYEAVRELSFKEKKLNVNLETTISKYNLPYLADFFTELVEKNHNITITVAHTGYLYRNEDGNKFLLGREDIADLEKIISIVKGGLKLASPVELIEKLYLERIVGFYNDSREQPVPCIALESSLALDAHGTINPCFMWDQRLGNIRDFNYSIKGFLEEKEELLSAVRSQIMDQKCPNCWTPCEAYQSIINNFLKFV